MGHAEWQDWVAFHGLFDFPDGFIVAGALGPPLAGLGGVKSTLEDFAPFYRRPPSTPSAPRPSNIPLAFAFLRAHVKPQPQ